MKVWQFAIALATTAITAITAIAASAVSEKVSENVPTAGLANLEELLAHQQWQAASDFTWKIFNPQEENTVDIEPISCTTIDNVDRLWTSYSDGRYGFSVQREVWQEIAGKQSPTTDDAEDTADAADAADEVWPLFYDRIGWDLSPEEAIATKKRGYFPVSDWWLTGETLTFGCGDYYCTIPRTVVEETVPAWDIVRSRWQDCQKMHPTR